MRTEQFMRACCLYADNFEISERFMWRGKYKDCITFSHGGHYHTSPLLGFEGEIPYNTFLQNTIDGINEYCEEYDIEQSKSNITVIPINYPVPVFFPVDPASRNKSKEDAIEYVLKAIIK